MKLVALLLALALSGCGDTDLNVSLGLHNDQQVLAHSQVVGVSPIRLNTWCVDGVLYYSERQWFTVAFDKVTKQPKLCEVKQ